MTVKHGEQKCSCGLQASGGVGSTGYLELSPPTQLYQDTAYLQKLPHGLQETVSLFFFALVEPCRLDQRVELAMKNSVLYRCRYLGFDLKVITVRNTRGHFSKEDTSQLRGKADR